jgi:hypothetical protein
VNPALAVLVHKYTVCLDRGGKWLVLLLWGVIFCIGAKFAPKFLTATSISFEAPSGTPSALAAGRMAAAFPAVANTINLAIVVDAQSSTMANSSTVRSEEAELSFLL